MNKSELRTQFKTLLNRRDCTNALADTLLDMGLNRIQRTLRIPTMEQSMTMTFSEALPDFFTLPNDFLEFIDVYYEGPSYNTKLRKAALGTAQALRRTGTPEVYTRFGSAVSIHPAPALGDEVTLLYYCEIPDLDEDTDENWLSVNAYDLWIYSALSYAADHFIDDRKETWEVTYVRIYKELEEQNRSLEFSAADMQVQPVYGNIEY
jgi:hypothetical protein